jgi:thiol-disulfide isomerase/thioredoxin
MNTQTMATRFCSLVAGVVATVVIGGAATNANAEAAGGHHSHAASASQAELMEQYTKLTAALDAIATHDPATLDIAMASGRPVLVAFLDRGCVECLRMIPVVTHLQKDLDKTVEIVVIDTDDKSEGFRRIYRRFSVWAGPAFVVLGRDGRRVDRLIGPQPEASLRARLDSVIAAGTSTTVQERRQPSQSPAPIAPSPQKVSGKPRT